MKSVRKANFPHELIALPLISIEPAALAESLRWIYLDLQAQETSPSDNFLAEDTTLISLRISFLQSL
jgi:hypothetical protein